MAKKQKEEGAVVKCANCGEEFRESDYAALCRAIARQPRLPVCSYECNKALGQAK